MGILMDNCRLCQQNTGSIPLQNELCELILEITNIKINDILELPNTICLNCNDKITEFNQYIKNIQKINSYLQKCIEKYVGSPCLVEVSMSKDNVEKQNDLNELKAKVEGLIGKKDQNQLFCNECHLFYDSENILNKNHVCKNSLDESVQKTNGEISEQINSIDIEETKIKNKFECKQCLKLYEDQQEYMSHLDAHDQFICKEKNCLKIYNSLRSFKEHQQIHEGKRPFLCVICGKNFASKKCLVCHEKIHADIKGYKCEVCNLYFSVRSNLRTHIRKHHEYSRFYCSQCPKEFMSKCSLDRHEKIHIGIKEFKCEDCTSAFYTKKELIKHQKYHQGVKLHKCEICFKAFFERHHLITHKRSHNGERPFICGTLNCGKSFYDKQKLKRHQKSVHFSKETQP